MQINYMDLDHNHVFSNTPAVFFRLNNYKTRATSLDHVEAGLMTALSPLEKHLCEHQELMDLRNKVMSLNTTWLMLIRLHQSVNKAHIPMEHLQKDRK